MLDSTVLNNHLISIICSHRSYIIFVYMSFYITSNSLFTLKQFSVYHNKTGERKEKKY